MIASKNTTLKLYSYNTFELIPTFCFIKSSNSLVAPRVSTLWEYLEIICITSFSSKYFQKTVFPKIANLTLFAFISHSVTSGSGISPNSTPDIFPKHLVMPKSLKYFIYSYI